MRVAEVSMLKVADVDRERMLLRVERGKGGRYRNAMLSEDLLTLLRDWGKVGRQQGVAEREADLLPVGYFHVVFTLPAEVADIAFQGARLRTAVQGGVGDDADHRRRSKHLGARIGITAVLHTWSSAMTHYPHVHMIVPGGGIAPDGSRWIASRPAFLLPVRVLGKLFRRLFLTRLAHMVPRKNGSKWGVARLLAQSGGKLLRRPLAHRPATE
jgi:hypothetical protein